MLVLATFFVHLMTQSTRATGTLDFFIAIYTVVLGSIVVLSTYLARQAGTDLRIFTRRPLESVLYGGQIRTLAMPWGGTEVPLMKRATVEIASLVAANENEFWQSTLGAIAFWLVVFAVLVGITRQSALRSSGLDLLAFLFFGLLLFFFSGGLGYFFSFFQPQFRAWNRLSLLISFVSLAYFGLIVAKMLDRLRASATRMVLGKLTIVILLLLLTNRDLFPAALRLDLSGYRSWTSELSSFTSTMESKLGPGCAVYQLPEAQFPEVPPVEELPVYELLSPAIYTKSLKYSYGGMKQGEWWLNKPTSRTTSISSIKKLGVEGYCGILIDSRGFAESQLAVTENLFRQMNLDEFRSSSGRWKLFLLK